MPISTIGAGSGAAGGALELIYSETVGSGGATTIDTGTLATGYRALIVYAYLRTDTVSVSLDGCNMHFNGDTNSGSTGNYELAGQFGGDINGGFLGGSFRAAVFVAAGGGADANFFNVCQAVIPNHENSVGYTQVSASLSRINKASTDRISYNNAMAWKDTAAVTSLQLSPTGSGGFVEGSAVYVYGVK